MLIRSQSLSRRRRRLHFWLHNSPLVPGCATFWGVRVCWVSGVCVRREDSGVSGRVCVCVRARVDACTCVGVCVLWLALKPGPPR